MNEKQLAKQVRDIANAPVLTHENRTRLYAVANELDPPKPEPGMAVWWRWQGEDDWHIGEVHRQGTGIRGIYPNLKDVARWENIEWKPARILGPRQVAVDVPPVSEWPKDAEDIRATFTQSKGSPFTRWTYFCSSTLMRVTHDEAERMEASDE